MIAIARKPPPPAATAAPASGLPPGKQVKKPLPDNTPLLPDKPGAGRTTRLGRRTETPALHTGSGPSGQQGKAQHNKRHPNK